MDHQFFQSVYHLVHSSDLWVILVFLLIFLPLCVELGFFIARFCKRRGNGYAMTETIPSSILGVHALLIGFTFSMSIDRYEVRRELVVKEANAIGTAYLRSQILPREAAQKSKDQYSLYIKELLQFGALTFDHKDLPSVQSDLGKIQDELWRIAKSTAKDSRSPMDAIYLQSLNDMFDLHAERWAALNNRLPLTVLALLLITLAASLISFGFVEAAKNQKGGFWLFVLSVLFAVVLTMIIDLDRPTRGFITVSQAPLEELYKTVLSQESAE